MAWGTDGGIQGWAADEQSGYKPPPGVGPHGHSTSDISTTVPTGSTGTPGSGTGGTVMIVYAGMIQLWYGAAANCPAGWAICDGTNGTPDMRGRVPVGLDSGQTEFDALGEAGGAKTHTLTEAEMPSHDHGASTQDADTSHEHSGSTDPGGTHVHAIVVDDNLGGNVALNSTAPTSNYAFQARVTQTGNPAGTADGSHSHGIPMSLQTHDHAVDADGGGGAHNNLQPYRTLHFIMKL